MVPIGDRKGPQHDCDALFVHRLFCFREFRSLDQTGQILCMIIVHKDVFNDLWGIYE